MSQPADAPTPPSAGPPRIERPIFVVAAPASGSRVLADALARSPSAWTAKPSDDGRPVIDSMPAVQAANRGWDADRLTGADTMGGEFAERLRTKLGESLVGTGGGAAPAGSTGLR